MCGLCNYLQSRKGVVTLEDHFHFFNVLESRSAGSASAHRQCQNATLSRENTKLGKQLKEHWQKKKEEVKGAIRLFHTFTANSQTNCLSSVLNNPADVILMSLAGISGCDASDLRYGCRSLIISVCICQSVYCFVADFMFPYPSDNHRIKYCRTETEIMWFGLKLLGFIRHTNLDHL